MPLPFFLDNQQHRLADALTELLAHSAGKPLDIATAYFAISGYRLVKEGLHQVGAFRLILGSEPQSGADVGLRPNAEALKKRLQGDLEAEPFNDATLTLVEALIGFLRADKVEVRLCDKGFLHAKAYLFHQAAAPIAVDPIQQTVSEEIKDAIRRRSVDREKAKACIKFLGQPMGRALHVKLKTANENWKASKDDASLVEEVASLSEQFGKQNSGGITGRRLCREDLELICFENVSG